MPDKTELLVATGNPNKLEEVRRILADSRFRIIGLGDIAASRSMPLEEPVEDGETFEENAAKKAIGYAIQTGRPCLADDSGLAVDALGGEPGVRSARYADPDARLDRPERDRLNNDKLLRALEGVETSRRTARFVCAMAIGTPDGRIVASSLGTFEGRIGEPPRVPAGAHGFGYDPLFLVGPSCGQTSAELLPDEKSRLSHRGVAARAIAGQLDNTPI